MKVLVKNHPYPKEPYVVAELTLGNDGGAHIRRAPGASKREFEDLVKELQSGIYDPRLKPARREPLTLKDGARLLEVLPYYYRTPYFWAEAVPT